MKKRNYLLLFGLFAFVFVNAQYDEYLKKELITKQGDTLLYRQLNPENIRDGEKYPLILFLHGAGERGKDNVSQLRNGGMMFTNPVNREKYPSFVLFPQCDINEYWPTGKRPAEGYLNGNPLKKDFPISNELQRVAELLDYFIANNPVDENRIYIMGLSMGGLGTLDFVCRFPNRFAAAISICGAVNIDRLREFPGKTKFRLYHGNIDNVIPVTFSREAYKALKQTGKDVEYIEFNGINHDSWNPSFNSEDFLSWLYEQKK